MPVWLRLVAIQARTAHELVPALYMTGQERPPTELALRPRISSAIERTMEDRVILFDGMQFNRYSCHEGDDNIYDINSIGITAVLLSGYAVPCQFLKGHFLNTYLNL